MKKHRNGKGLVGKKLFLGLLFGCLFLLAGCTAKLDTKLELTPEFSGQRVMTVTLKKSDVGKLSSGMANMVEKYCPPELTYTASANNQSIIYTFTLSFSSKEEYTQKVEALLNHGVAEGEPRRTPTILYTRPDTVLMTGYRYSEDFTSADLLRWIDQAVGAEGGTQQDFSWEIGATTLNYDGSAVRVKDQIALDSISTYAVDVVEITTNQREDGLFEREISISFPQATIDALGESLTNYLQDRIPQNGSGGWEAQEAPRSFTFTLPFTSLEEIKNATRQILNGEQAAVTFQEDTANETATVERYYFDEELDLSSYASGKSNQARLIYRFNAADGYQVDNGGIYQEGAFQKVGEVQNESSYLYQGEHSLAHVRVELSRTHLLSGVEIILNHTVNQDLFEREIVFLYDSTKHKNGANYAVRYFNEIRPSAGKAVRETRGQYDLCRVVFKGSSQAVTQTLSALFGEGNRLVFQNDKETLRLKNHSFLQDFIAMEDFLGEENASVLMTYTVRIGNAQQVEALAFTQQGAVTEAKITDGKQTQTFTLPSSSTTVSYHGSFINVLGVIAISALTFIGTTLVLLAIAAAVKRWKKKKVLPAEFPLPEFQPPKENQPKEPLDGDDPVQ